MNPPSPALRPLQLSSDGKTLIGRSPCSKGGNGSPARQCRGKGHEKQIKKITSYFTSNGNSSHEPIVVAPLEAVEEECVAPTKIKISTADVGVNTELALAHLDAWTVSNDSEEILEKLYSTGPTEKYWKTCADEIRKEFNKAQLEKLAADEELEALLEEKRKLEEELQEYNEYFELREYSRSVLGKNDD